MVKVAALAYGEESSLEWVSGTREAVRSAQASSTPANIAVTRLNLIDYRNICQLRIESEARILVLAGPNGAGKTNILESLSFLSPGRGLRRARLGDVSRRDGGGAWAVAARLSSHQDVIEVGTGLAPSEQGVGRRVVKIDGEATRGTAPLTRALTVNWLTPQMDRLFLEGPGPRRRYLDRLVYGFDSEHASRVSAYDRAMRERSRLLRHWQGDTAWLSALEETMAGYGVAVAMARKEATARLSIGMDACVSPFPTAEVAVDGEIERLLDDFPAVEVESQFREALEAGRSRDAQIGGATSGPHRSDFVVRHREKDMPAASCSTGEQKSLLISIVLADARLQEACLGRAPLLLLDEVVAHLDAERRSALFEVIAARTAQTWITGTDCSLFDELTPISEKFDVADGRVTGRPH
jgi:DNA replication and repair protein RecF